MCGSGWCAPSIHTTNSGGSTSKSTNTTFLFGFAHSHKQALLVCANTLSPTSGAFIVSFLAKKKEKASSSCNQVHPSCHITLSPPQTRDNAILRRYQNTFKRLLLMRGDDTASSNHGSWWYFGYRRILFGIDIWNKSKKKTFFFLFFDTTEASPTPYRHLVPLRLRMCARTLRLLLKNEKHLLADASSWCETKNRNPLECLWKV